ASMPLASALHALFHERSLKSVRSNPFECKPGELPRRASNHDVNVSDLCDCNGSWSGHVACERSIATFDRDGRSLPLDPDREARSAHGCSLEDQVHERAQALRPSSLARYLNDDGLLAPAHGELQAQARDPAV